MQHKACLDILDLLHAIARPSVCHTGVSYKTVEVIIIMEFTPYGSPIPLVFAG